MSETKAPAPTPSLAAPEAQSAPAASPSPESTARSEQHEFSPAHAAAGGREILKHVLYVGGLRHSVAEDRLREYLGLRGGLVSVKILHDKNKPGFNYAFVEFTSDAAASTALSAFNGSVLDDAELKINFAYQLSTFSTSQSSAGELFNVFVGDLSPEVDDEALYKFFAHFQSLKQAHVMWDMQTGRSRGYGFATFRLAADAEQALQTMTGKELLGRAIRCNWASHKLQPQQAAPRNNPRNSLRPFRQPFQRYAGYNNYSGGYNTSFNGSFNGGYSSSNFTASNFNTSSSPYSSGTSSPGGHEFFNGSSGNSYNGAQTPIDYQSPTPALDPMVGALGGIAGGSNSFVPQMTTQSYENVVRQAPSWQTTVYLGNMASFTQQSDLLPLLQNYGFIVDFKYHPEKRCAFVKYDSHERAALAIVQLAGFIVNGRPLKCGWGKTRSNNQYNGQYNGQYQRNNGNAPIFYR